MSERIKPEVKTLVGKIRAARNTYVAGNGGSASTAEHFTNDLFSRGIRAMCLNSNTSIMTMIGNDFGYEYVFSKQLKLWAQAEDLLITISCSGKSPNILLAQKIAWLRKMDSYAFATFKGDDKDYGALEDQHLIFSHEVAAALGEKQ